MDNKYSNIVSERRKQSNFGSWKNVGFKHKIASKWLRRKPQCHKLKREEPLIFLRSWTDKEYGNKLTMKNLI